MDRPGIAITGLGFISPIGNDYASVASSLREQRHGLRPIDWFPGCPYKLAGLVPDFDISAMERAKWTWPKRYTVARETLRSLPPHGLYAFCAMEQALEDARLSRADLGDGSTGLFCASAGSPRFLRHHVNEAADTIGQRVAPWGVVTSIAGTLNFNLAAHYGIRGAVTGFVSACAASAHALGYAHDEIMLGRQQRMIVVGAEEPLWESLLPFGGLRALSRQADPALASRPFDRGRDGFVGAGGAVALILEDAALARRRGARSYAELIGWGQSADGHSIAQSDPEGQGLARAMRLALASARIAPAELDYVNAHATSTVVGDRAEVAALRAVLGEARPPVSSTKGLTGHSLSMSAALEAGICAIAMAEGFIPGNAHLRDLDPLCGGLDLPRENIARAPQVVLSNSSGFGGSNVCVVLRRPGD